jgi:hypothetical protein
VRWLIPIAGTILAATDKLTSWWGIAIIAVLALLHFMDGMVGVDREARTTTGEPDVYGLLQFFVITFPMVAGLFVGNAIADALGAAIGSVALGLAGSFAWSALFNRTDREIPTRDSGV